MSPEYKPQDHIHPLDVAPPPFGILDQREVTLHSYQTTVPFGFKALDERLECAWLAPHIEFGLFARLSTEVGKSLNVVLALQDELKVRVYKYDERRPLWYSWQNTIADTVNLHYFRDRHGLLNFTITGGGRRISHKQLHQFNESFLGIAKDAVMKREFDPVKLRNLCFDRFGHRLYMLQFLDPSGKEYHSIDHAQFKSKKLIDPKAERVKEIRADAQVKITSFKSHISLSHGELAVPTLVRFEIRASSGSLWMRFRKPAFVNQYHDPAAQVNVFYRLVDAAAEEILDDDYYARDARSLVELQSGQLRFPGLADLKAYRHLLTDRVEQRRFILSIDLDEPKWKWTDPLHALDELLASEVIATDVQEILSEFVARNQRMVLRLLDVCRNDAKLLRIGALLAPLLADRLPRIPVELRPPAEQLLLAWAVEHDRNSWDVDTTSAMFVALGLKWRIDDIAFDELPKIVWKLLGVLHSRLEAEADATSLLEKYHWCLTLAASLPEHHSQSHAALRLVAAGKIPRSAAESEGILKKPVQGLRELDEALREQFGLPLWPHLTATRQGDSMRLVNDGIGSALSVRIGSSGTDEKPSRPPCDLVSGESMLFTPPDRASSIGLSFEKFGRTYRVSLPVAAAGTNPDLETLSLPVVVNRSRLAAQREYRRTIDPEGVVVGSSPALLEVFEKIHHANATKGEPPVLLLGEPGVGKTHIAQLIHSSSNRKSNAFHTVSGGGVGGDLNIQRGEWIGHGKGHGIQGIDKGGQSGHLMKSHGGTLFVDEFDGMSREMQRIFLTVLERGKIEKVSGESFQPDVRCIFATNANIEELVKREQLRRDLIDRLPVQISIPPLRMRRGDILPLARSFAGHVKMSDRCQYGLLCYDWPGNIRQLRQTITAAIAHGQADGASTIDLAHLGLPLDVVPDIEIMDNKNVRREVWTLADKLARREGWEPGEGLQRRVGEIFGVGDSHVSKMYRAFGLPGGAAD